MGDDVGLVGCEKESGCFSMWPEYNFQVGGRVGVSVF